MKGNPESKAIKLFAFGKVSAGGGIVFSFFVAQTRPPGFD
jgi:hypothetical protein